MRSSSIRWKRPGPWEKFRMGKLREHHSQTGDYVIVECDVPKDGVAYAAFWQKRKDRFLWLGVPTYRLKYAKMVCEWHKWFLENKPEWAKKMVEMGKSLGRDL